MFWKEDWDRARKNLTDWWHGRGLALSIVAPKDVPWEPLPEPLPPADLRQRWLDPVYRARRAEYELSRTYFGAEAFPFFDTHIGPGNLATFLGSEPAFAPTTVWYERAFDSLGAMPPLRLDPNNPHFRAQMAILQEGARIARGRFLVSMPDLIENIDTLASLRGSEELLIDLLDEPELVEQKLEEINQAWFDAFERFYQQIKDEHGGNCFSAFKIWGPGRTAKVQCDAAAMMSNDLLRRFFVPAVRRQCAWLDFSLYHLDGTQAIHHLDTLLEIEELDVIEWTPQAGVERGGDKRWYDLYRRIRAAGKSVQAIDVAPETVIPLIEAVGPDGLFMMVHAPDETSARKLVEQVEPYRR